MSNTKKNFIISGLLLIIAIIYTILVQKIDVKPIGPENSSVGFATVNEAVSNQIKENTTLGYSEILYDITKYLGYLSLAMCVIYAFVGLAQLIKRKSLFKVDKEIFMLAAFYIVVIALYVLFELYIVNYRPVIMEEGLEASYPSSHTMLAVCVCGSAIILNKKLFKDFKQIKIVNILCGVLLVTTVVGRLLSGVHWFSDIIGSIIISSALLMSFYSLINMKKEEK